MVVILYRQGVNRLSPVDQLLWYVFSVGAERDLTVQQSPVFLLQFLLETLALVTQLN